MSVFDLGGQSSIRPYWRLYTPNTDALIYVVDSCDVARLEDSRLALVDLLKQADMAKVSVLVFANKQDAPGALSGSDVSQRLGLPTCMVGREWAVFGTSATKGVGLHAGMQWLVNALGGELTPDEKAELVGASPPAHSLCCCCS